MNYQDKRNSLIENLTKKGIVFEKELLDNITINTLDTLDRREVKIIDYSKEVILDLIDDLTYYKIKPLKHINNSDTIIISDRLILSDLETLFYTRKRYKFTTYIDLFIVNGIKINIYSFKVDNDKLSPVLKSLIYLIETIFVDKKGE